MLSSCEAVVRTDVGLAKAHPIPISTDVTVHEWTGSIVILSGFNVHGHSCELVISRIYMRLNGHHTGCRVSGSYVRKCFRCSGGGEVMWTELRNARLRLPLRLTTLYVYSYLHFKVEY